MPLRNIRPVTEYLEKQQRFRHLFTEDLRAKEELEHIQAIADHTILKSTGYAVMAAQMPLIAKAWTPCDAAECAGLSFSVISFRQKFRSAKLLPENQFHAKVLRAKLYLA